MQHIQKIDLKCSQQKTISLKRASRIVIETVLIILTNVQSHKPHTDIHALFCKFLKSPCTPVCHFKLMRGSDAASTSLPPPPTPPPPTLSLSRSSVSTSEVRKQGRFLTFEIWLTAQVFWKRLKNKDGFAVLRFDYQPIISSRSGISILSYLKFKLRSIRQNQNHTRDDNLERKQLQRGLSISVSFFMRPFWKHSFHSLK